MTKKICLIIGGIALVAITFSISIAQAESEYAGKIVKLEGQTTLYYVTAEGKRYVFPNEKIYKSWFTDFSDVVTITAEEMAELTLAGSIHYRPGVILIKIQTDPKVYAVSKGGVLRWIKTEKLAKKLYGENWHFLIDDLTASFFAHYTAGDSIDDEGDYDADEEINNTDTIEGNRGLKLGHLDPTLKAETKKCRAVRAEPAQPHEGKKTATPAISARVCKLNIIKGVENGDEIDETAPVISNISIAVATSTATITWETDEEANSKVEYATESLNTATTTETVIDSELVTEHSLELTNLTPSTTYYFIVQSADDNSNIATSTEQTFTTEAE